MRLHALSLMMLVATGAAAQNLPAYRHRILGVFNSDGKPLEGVEVTDMKSGTTALTTVTGTVTLAYLPDGGSEVRVRQLGYVPVTQFIRIGPADTTPVTVILTESANVLPALVSRDTARPISPGLRDFEERRKHGPGYFIGEKELRKSDNREMVNVVRTIPHVTVSCAKYALSGGGLCQFLIYVDGMRTTETDLNMLRVSQFAGIESYTGAQIPVKYNATGSACGVLLFWSRER
jgi:hypothetical protein